MEADDPGLPTAVARALDGGAPLSVLPTDPVAAARTRTALRPSEPVVEEDAALLLPTSGSTGEPKVVVLSAAAVRASVAATSARTGAPGSWALALPVSGVAGLMVVARAALTGATLHRVPADLADPALTPVGDGPHHLSVVPTQLHRVRDDPAALERLARYDTVLVGGAATDGTLLAALRQHGVPLVTTYGMSETCGGCVYDGRPLDGVAVTCDPADQRIRITTPTAFSGYRGRPDLTAEVLVGPGTVLTADRGRLADGRLQVLGRLDDVVVSGGSNVDLALVEGVLRELLGTDQVAVTSAPDPEWGARVVAVLAAPAPDVDLEHLRGLLRPRTDPAALPKQLLRVPVLPLLPGGKTDRVALRATASHPDHVLPEVR
ncbi:O-succinylbenzoic acid--CoA ligase [Auraticoccus monumenti]|uniref:O-succinylbenzoic acid--CoA ligase n=1 Tax=Auraticoccus monumenti TaxID=675864 RepID=A0A1G6WLA2_9ACTN|nr:O-succinylbenzoic acid--CoA ligase [Auraticoccus monumenti]